MSNWSLGALLGVSPAEMDGMLRSNERLLNRKALGPDELAMLISVRDVEDIAGSKALVWPIVQVTRNLRELPVKAYTVPESSASDSVRYVDTLKLFRCFRDGGSVVFRDMHRYWPPLGELSWDLARSLGCAVSVNGYLTPPATQGLRPHFDYFDIIVIQVAGRKEWLAYDTDADRPLGNTKWRTAKGSVDPSIPGEDAAVTGSVILEAGDVLFVPRGSTHAVRSHDGVSLHLTLILQGRTYFDVATTVLRQVGRSRSLREALSLPGYPGDTGDRLGDGADERFGELAARVGVTELAWQLFRDSTVDMFESPVPLVRQFDSYHQLRDSTPLVRRRDLVFQVHDADGTVWLRLRDRDLKFPVVFTGPLHRALSGEPITVASCASRSAPPDACRKMVLTLLAEGVLVPADDEMAEAAPRYGLYGV